MMSAPEKVKSHKFTWFFGLAFTLAIIVIPVFVFSPKAAAPVDNALAFVPAEGVHSSHADILQGPYLTGPDVTRACLECHPDAAVQMMGTTHWTWESKPFEVSWRDEPVTVGKINQLNNFCISSVGNQKRCATCHTGYGWQEDAPYDFSVEENVDCLVCHADTAAYAKGEYGNPVEGIDLLATAQSVRLPNRDNCGQCHFNGGGGNGVKHGDLDESLYFPSESLDVHMGRLDFVCTDCHQTEDHVIRGRLVADNITVSPDEQVACTDCHAEAPHDDARINLHTDSVACQTCHVPSMALKNPTKTQWDWSTAGQDRPDDHYTYLKIKGSFVYEKNVTPAYLWFNGNLSYRYLIGDEIDPSQRTYINLPAGGIEDEQAKIFPFKIHIAKQPYDSVYNYLLQPITAGENGYWTNFDWDSAFRLAESVTGLDYSGQYGFAETRMFWPTTHMVQPKEEALGCTGCHGPEGRLDWQALEYPGDPMEWGSRFADR